MYGVIHVTVYHTTQHAMVQGNPYLIWYTEHFLYILSLAHAPTKQPQSEGAISVPSKSDNQCSNSECGVEEEDFIQCDACDAWAHFDVRCSGLAREEVERAAGRDEVFICCNCTRACTDGWDVDISKIEAAGSMYVADLQAPAESSDKCHHPID